MVKAKFHYAILLANQLVRYHELAGLRPASELAGDLLAGWNLAYHALSSSLAGLRPDQACGHVADQVCDLVADHASAC